MKYRIRKSGIRLITSAILLAAAVVAPLPVPAGGLEASLSVDRENVVVGEAVGLLVRVSGPGTADGYRIEQPPLPMLTKLSLEEVSQRNELVAGPGGESFTVSFLYALLAEKTGEERIPSLEIRYRAEGDEEDRTMSVEGVTIGIDEKGRGGRSLFVSAALLVAVAVILLIALRVRKYSAAAGSAVAEALPVKDPDAPAVALGRIEDAGRLRLSGETGAYCVEVRAALDAYLETRPDMVIRDLAERIGGLCEQVKYAGDEDAEIRIGEVVRKAELHLKKTIRDEYGDR